MVKVYLVDARLLLCRSKKWEKNMGMQPKESLNSKSSDNEVVDKAVLQNFIDDIISDAKKGVSGVLSNIKMPSIKNEEQSDVLNINREMVRQVIQRPDVQYMLDLREKGWKLNFIESVTSLVMVLGTSALFFRRPFFGVLVFLIGLIVVLFCNAVKSVNIPKNFTKLIREITGSEEHLRVFEDMLKNTPYSTKSGKTDNWLYNEMRNFREKDKEFLIQQNIKDKSNSIKTELLRNINKD